MTIDPNKLKTAKKWADWAKSLSLGEGPRAAVQVIDSLPAHIIDADQVREIIEEMQQNLDVPTISEHGAGHDSATADWKKALESLLPAPKPKTLADMTPEERAECQWMQADHVEHGRVIITHPGDTYIYYMKPSGLSGGASNIGSDRITPLPDLPRMVWPASESDVSIISPKIDTSTEHDDSVNMTPEQPIKAVTTRTAIAQASQIQRLQKVAVEAEVLFWEATGHDLTQQLERRGAKLERNDLEDMQP